MMIAMLAGCRDVFGIGSASAIDSSIGDGHDGDGGAACYGAHLVMVCFASAPTGVTSISGAPNTDSSPPCSGDVTSGGNGLCVVGAETIEVAGAAIAKFSGSKPLVLVATGSVMIDGTLDVSSGSNSATGPGADYSGCGSGGSAGNGGGGAGGSFGAVGGDGGGPSQGTAAAVVAATTLHGGCAGHNGGGTGDTGPRGHGGGAVYIIAVDQITVDQAGVIDASGGGGGAPEPAASGAGGGGTGGMIGLEAPTVVIDGSVIANGGGGGQGGSTTGNSLDGMSGSKGGSGGSGTGNGGVGGDGGHDATAASPGSAGTGTTGGGGGGGGVGVVNVFGTQSGSGTISPSPS